MKKELRGSRVAKLMLETAIEHVISHKMNPEDNIEISLITSELQNAARRFYSREGFTLVRKHRGQSLGGIFSLNLHIFDCMV